MIEKLVTQVGQREQDDVVLHAACCRTISGLWGNREARPMALLPYLWIVCSSAHGLCNSVCLKKRLRRSAFMHVTVEHFMAARC
jgi:hypothetical protein